MKRRVMEFLKKICCVLLVSAMIAGSGSFFAFAEEEGEETEQQEEPVATGDMKVTGSRTTDDAIYIYVNGAQQIDADSTVQIGNTLCDNVQTASLEGCGVPVKTMIILDNSKSISVQWGNNALELMRQVVSSGMDNEEFKIATFATDLTVCQDYTSDKEKALAAIDAIEYKNQESYLTDILCDELESVTDNGSNNYYRFIIISDGADATEVKLLQTDMYKTLEASHVQINGIGVKVGNSADSLSGLQSCAKTTNGVYMTVDKSTGIEDVLAKLNEYKNTVCIKVVPDNSIMDGLEKAAKLTLKSNGAEKVLKTNLEMPFGTGVPEVAEVEEPDTDKEEAPTPKPMPKIEKKVPEQPPVEEKKGSVLTGIIIAVVIAVIAAAVIAVVLIMRKKKRENAEAANVGNMTAAAASDPGKTVLLNPLGEGSGATVLLDYGSNGVKQSTITLRDTSNPQRVFTVPIVDKVVIGRVPGPDVQIALEFDAAVSSKHCEIVKRGNLYYVNDLHSSNHTYYNDMQVMSEMSIMTGGILTIGKNRYSIEIDD